MIPSRRLTLSLLALSIAIPFSATAHPIEGSWVGWAWLGDAGDLPLMFHVEEKEGRVTAQFDSPAHRRYGTVVETMEWSNPQLEMRWTSSSGTEVSLRGSFDRNEIEGSIQWGPYEGTFEVVRSSRTIVSGDPIRYESAAGFYQRSQHDVIELRARPWGELVLREARTGRVRTLFPVGGDQFFIGEGLYLPSSQEGEIELVRNDGGDVIGLSTIDSAGHRTRFERIDLLEEPVSFTSDGVVLKGTLVRTPGEARPAVVMLGGSSWETRVDVSFHAMNLASMGFAVLSYDKRGHGESGGEPISPFSTTARDAIAAIEFLEAHPEIDPERTGILGMSRGGWYGPLAAASSDAIDFLVLLVPPAVSPAAQETTSRLAQMRADGFDDETVDLVRRLLAETWEWIATGENWDDYLRLRSRAVEAGAPDYVLESDSPDGEAWMWGRLNMFFDPCHVLGMLEIPILAIFGEHDLHVDSGVNRARLEECVGPGAELTAHTIAGATHSLAVPNELPTHRQTGRGDEGYSLVADWARRTILDE